MVSAKVMMVAGVLQEVPNWDPTCDKKYLNYKWKKEGIIHLYKINYETLREYVKL